MAAYDEGSLTRSHFILSFGSEPGFIFPNIALRFMAFYCLNSRVLLFLVSLLEERR
jgi:hypothetical protein